MSKNLIDELLGEMERVSALRAKTATLDGRPGINVKPLLAMMDASLDRARAAISDGDIVAGLRAINDLKGYES